MNAPQNSLDDADVFDAKGPMPLLIITDIRAFFAHNDDWSHIDIDALLGHFCKVAKDDATLTVIIGSPLQNTASYVTEGFERQWSLWVQKHKKQVGEVTVNIAHHDGEHITHHVFGNLVRGKCFKMIIHIFDRHFFKAHRTIAWKDAIREVFPTIAVSRWSPGNDISLAERFVLGQVAVESYRLNVPEEVVIYDVDNEIRCVSIPRK